jgi:hypothetical protein
MPTKEQDAWLRKALGVEARPAAAGGLKGLFEDLKNKFRPVKEAGAGIKRVYDDVQAMKEKIDKAKEDYDNLAELLEQARAAKEKCDSGDPDGIREARDFLAEALEKAQKLKLPPGGKELLQVYKGALLSTKIVEDKDFKADGFEKYMVDAESKGDAKAVVEYARQVLCDETPRLLTTAEFDKRLQKYIVAHPKGKVAAAYRPDEPEEPSAAPAPSPRTVVTPNDQDLNARIAEEKVKPLKDKYDEARRDAQFADRRADRVDAALEAAQKQYDETMKAAQRAAAETVAARKALERAKALPVEPRNRDAIVIGSPSPVKTAQKKLDAAMATLEVLKGKTTVAKGALGKTKVEETQARDARLKAQAAVSAAEDAYQRTRLDWYSRARLASPKLALPGDLQAWKDGRRASPG